MSIDSITPLTNSTSSSANQGPAGVKGTKDEFLRLFMAQLQHQDPFAPTSGADMVAQLAQLSSVEQAKQTNDQLAEIAAAQSAAASAGLSSLVGRDCSAVAGTFQLDKPAGGAPPLEISTTGPMKGASVVITNADGKELRRIAIPDGARAQAIQWDGKDASGNTVPPGSYKIAVDSGQTAQAITAQWRGPIEAVELTSDGPRLRMGGLLLSPGDIRSIGNTTTNNSSAFASGRGATR